MIAYRLRQPQEPPQFQEVPKPSKAQLEERHATPPPFTLGHEIAGWVAEVGPRVIGFKTGEPVAVVPLWGSCGHCPPCRRGDENFCHYMSGEFGAGIGFDGGSADYIAVPPRYAVHMGDLRPGPRRTPDRRGSYNVHGNQAGLVIAGSRKRGGGYWGRRSGAVGDSISPLSLRGRVIAVDNDPKHPQLAKEHGADNTLPSGTTTTEQVRSFTAGAGATCVLDCVGAEPTLKTGIASLATLGRGTLVGAAGGRIPFGRWLAEGCW